MMPIPGGCHEPKVKQLREWFNSDYTLPNQALSIPGTQGMGMTKLFASHISTHAWLKPPLMS
jgi:hypothetical protein